MNECERYEIFVSSWLDGELDRGGQIEMVDHLTRCGACREFYLAARGLGGLVAMIRTPSDAPEPSAELWRRVQRDSTREQAGRAAGTMGVRRRGGRWLPAWAGTAAAALVLTVWLGSLLSKDGSVPATRPVDAEIRLGEDRGRMNDARFVELTREVLRADRRYVVAFYEVMGQVVRETRMIEAPTDVLGPSRELRQEPESAEAARGPA